METKPKLTPEALRAAATAAEEWKEKAKYPCAEFYRCPNTGQD